MDSELAKIMFDQTVEKYHQALNAFVQGNATLILEIFSKQDEVSLADSNSMAVRGYKNVVITTEKAASNYHEGESTGFENLVKVVTTDLAFLVEYESYTSSPGIGQDRVPINLRATSIFRMEAGGWKLLHRHADAIVPESAPETMMQKQAMVSS